MNKRIQVYFHLFEIVEEVERSTEALFYFVEFECGVFFRHGKKKRSMLRAILFLVKDKHIWLFNKKVYYHEHVNTFSIPPSSEHSIYVLTLVHVII